MEYASASRLNNLQMIGQGTQAELIDNPNRQRIGLESVYIAPKRFVLDDDEPEQQQEEQQHKHSDRQPKKRESSNKLSKKSSSHRNDQRQASQPEPEALKKETSQIYQQSIIVIWIEVIVWVGFLIGSIPMENLIKWVDIGVNAFCLLKIIILHISIAILNKRHKQGQSSETIQVSPYTNQVKLYEFIQLWSIILTCISCIFLDNILIFQILASLKTVRLFFPLAIKLIPSKNLPSFQIIVHILKLLICGTVLTLLFSIMISNFYAESQNYLCFGSQQLATHYTNSFTDFKLDDYQNCGINNECGQSQQCLNIYSYSNGQADYQKVNEVIGSRPLGNYEENILNAYLLTSSPGDMLGKYQQNESLPFLLSIFLILWVVSFCWGAIQVGQTLRAQTLMDWVSKQEKIVCKQYVSETAIIRNEKRRNSNISFNLQKYQQAACQRQNTEESQSKQINQLQISEEFEAISNQFYDRAVLTKILTILFNLVCLSHVVLVTLDELQLDQITDLNINITLGAYFIIWSIGLVAAGIQVLGCKQQIEKQNSNKNYILLYEVFAYGLTLIDYILRFQDGKLIIYQQSAMTPFSHAAISLRVIFIIYNNGFDSVISCYIEKIIRNFWINVKMVALIVLCGFIFGLIQLYWITLQEIDGEKIGVMNNWVLMSTGFGGKLGQGWVSSTIFAIFKVVGGVFGLFIAKNVNLGFDSIFDVQFAQPEPQEDESQVIKSEPSLNCLTSENFLRKFCTFLYNIKQYRYLKAFLIVGYTVTAFIYTRNPSKQLKLGLFVLDIWLIFDIFVQIVCVRMFGKFSFFWKYPLLKGLFCITQLFLFIVFFIPVEELRTYEMPLRIFRLLLLVQTFPSLEKITNQMYEIFFNQKLKYYRIILMALGLLFLGMCLTARYTSHPDIPIENKFINLIGYGINFAFGIGYGFSPESMNDHLNIMAITLVAIGFSVFYHVLTVFMIVTYFVIHNNMKSNQEQDLVLDKFTSAKPQDYDYCVNNDGNMFAYIKMVKIIIIVLSTVLLCMLKGIQSYNDAKDSRLFIAGINLALVVLEICIYFYQNMCLKVPSFQWPILETFAIVVSIPGSFFLMFNPSKFAGSLGLRLFIQIFIFFSAIRLFRIIPLMINRQARSFELLRRIKNTVPFREFLRAVLILCTFMMPFAVFQSLLYDKNILNVIIGYITGPSFSTNPTQSPQIGQVFIKLMARILYLPMNSYCLAKIISSFLTNSPTWITIRKDKFKQIICQSGILDDGRSNLYVKGNQFYKIAARIMKKLPKGILSLKAKKKGNVLKYDQVIELLKEMNLQVFVGEEIPGDQEEQVCNFQNKMNTEKNYVIMVYDIIYYIYCYSIGKDQFDKNQIKSLLNKLQQRPEGLSKANMGTHEYSILLGMKRKLVNIVASKAKFKAKSREPKL